MTLPEIVQSNQLNPTWIGQSQLYLLVAFYVLQRHNLFLLRNYRHDYLMSFPQRLSHLPQGLGNAPSNAARDRMVDLVGNILTQMTSMTTSRGVSSGEEVPRDSAQGAFLLNQPDAVASSGYAATSQPITDHKDACSAISALLCYLKDDSSALSQPCDISDICIEAIHQCQPLLKHRQVDMNFAGRRRVLPLRVLFVDDNQFVIKFLERLARNRGYYYESCLDGESCVKVFEATLQIESNACDRFDLIIMDKEMPTKEASGFRTAGVTAVKKLRELCKLYAEQEPGFKYPCIIGNSTCQDEDDATVIEFRSELERMRQQAGMATTALMVKGKMDSWTDQFDADVRRLCCLGDTLESDAYRLPTVWGTCTLYPQDINRLLVLF
jgi:CheY-like chemotaxis protein